MIDYRRDVGMKHSELLSLMRKFNSSAPNTGELQDNIIGFGTAIKKYELFKTPDDTKSVLDKYKTLISI